MTFIGKASLFELQDEDKLPSDSLLSNSALPGYLKTLDKALAARAWRPRPQRLNSYSLPVSGTAVLICVCAALSTIGLLSAKIIQRNDTIFTRMQHPLV